MTSIPPESALELVALPDPRPEVMPDPDWRPSEDRRPDIGDQAQTDASQRGAAEPDAAEPIPYGAFILEDPTLAMEGPSPVAQALADWVPDLPRQTIIDLRRLLEHDQAVPTPALRRNVQLGLLVDLIRDDGEVPAWDAYDRERAERARRGEDWPDRTTLAKAYGGGSGGWIAACKAAANRAFKSGRASGGKTRRQPGPVVSYSQALDALIDAREQCGTWLNQWEFPKWAEVQRQIARGAHKPLPRIPSLKRIRQLFDSYPAAVAKAKERSRTTLFD